jgi:hypothetical protein
MLVLCPRTLTLPAGMHVCMERPYMRKGQEGVAHRLLRSAARSGTVVVTGNIGNATITAQGTGNTYVSGLNTSATVKSSGTGGVYLNTTAGQDACLQSCLPVPCRSTAPQKAICLGLRSGCADHGPVQGLGEGVLFTGGLQRDGEGPVAHASGESAWCALKQQGPKVGTCPCRAPPQDLCSGPAASRVLLRCLTPRHPGHAGCS